MGLARNAVALTLAFVAYEVLMYGGTTRLVSIAQQSAPTPESINPDIGRAGRLGGPTAGTGAAPNPATHQIATFSPPLTTARAGAA